MIRDLAWLRSRMHAIDVVLFAERLQDLGVRIAWDRWRKTTTTFVYGRYLERKRTISVNPVLKHAWVPASVVIATITHEAAHAVYGSDHNDTLTMAEKRYPFHAEAELWAAEHIDELLAARPPKRGK